MVRIEQSYQLEKQILLCFTDYWDYTDLQAWRRSKRSDPVPAALDTTYLPLTRTLDHLRTRWAEAELSRLAADMYFDPAGWQHPYMADWDQQWTMLLILRAILLRFPPPDLLKRIERRMTLIFEHPLDSQEIPAPHRSRCWPPDLYLSPTLEGCLDLLRALPTTDEVVALVEKVALGELDRGPFDVAAFSGSSRDPLKSAYDIYHADLVDRASWMWEFLYDRGRFDYNAFRIATGHLPFLLGTFSMRHTRDGALAPYHARVSEAFSAAVTGYCGRLACEMVQDINEDNCDLLTWIYGLRGSRYLVAVARQHSRHGLGRLVREPLGSPKSVQSAIVHVARAADTEPSSTEDRRRVVAELRALSPDTLKYLLPIAPGSRHLLCDALSWEAVAPLVEQVVLIGRPDAWRDFSPVGYGRAEDSSAGVLDVLAVRGALGAAGEPLAREVLSLFREARVGADDAVMLIEAVAGWNRPQIRKSLAKRKHAAVKAYGLLPLERGEDEAMERYLFLQAFTRESKKLGAERQANEAAAVQAALANLAQVAGYPDEVRLEWAMEARLGATAAPDRSWMVDDYRIELKLDVDKPELVFSRAGRALKSPSDAVRKSQAYAEARDAVGRLRAQMGRFRDALENMLAAEDLLSRDDMERLLRLPVLGGMLGRLILRGDDGVFGLFDPTEHVLITAEGSAAPIVYPVCAAHPYHLLSARQMAAWQREIVRRRIVQPFKQAFREVYLLTLAERETRDYSNRFAGHIVAGRVASKLLQVRGWQVEGGDIALPYKLFRKRGLASFFGFPDAGHYLGELDTMTSDRVYFQPIDARDRWLGWQDKNRVPLANVPPVVFSEVMRDADLVVSVAQHAEDGPISEETYQQRAAVVTSLLDDLKLPGVTAEGHFAHVQGKLARYRIHLGSAAIHIEPGNYLCVVPANKAGRPERFFLPFADDGDSKIAEVISKILLLASDDKIKDDTILRQIRAAQPSQSR